MVQKEESKKLYREIMSALCEDGEAACEICGKQYRFIYSEFGTEIWKNEEFFCTVSQRWELMELVEDLIDERK